ncbi:hypothetical protein ACRALDRAFT_207462 [Sodiomyces alcalophilus JCM 7366]|uniref:uncharacterized protein n=1 Tax=Sodiomyces alcalophilus JCM 7366 TaxID=591952 RepID=UPI0039B54D50
MSPSDAPKDLVFVTCLSDPTLCASDVIKLGHGNKRIDSIGKRLRETVVGAEETRTVEVDASGLHSLLKCFYAFLPLKRVFHQPVRVSYVPPWNLIISSIEILFRWSVSEYLRSGLLNIMTELISTPSASDHLQRFFDLQHLRPRSYNG